MGVQIKVVNKRRRRFRPLKALKRLFTPVRYIKLEEAPDKRYCVFDVNPEAKELFEGLGIDEERKKQIIEIALRAYFKSSNICSAMEKASEKVNNANELFAVSFIMTRKHVGDNGPEGALMALLGGRLGGGDE